MQTVVAVDPGVTTGVAVLRSFKGQTRVERTFVSRYPHEGLGEQLLNVNADYIVAERGPSRRRQPEACLIVEQILYELFPDRVEWVRPAEWKGHPRSALPPGVYPRTLHERDACGMGLFALWRAWVSSLKAPDGPRLQNLPRGRG